MYCKKCGNRLKEDSIFCGECGTKVRAKTENKSDLTTGNVTINNGDNLNVASSNVVQSKKVTPKSWYEEIGAINVNEYSKKFNFDWIIYLIMTISMVWLVVAFFLPIIEDISAFSCVEELLDNLHDFSLKYIEKYEIRAIFYLVVFILGGVYLIKYFGKLFDLNGDDEVLCKNSIITTILLSLPTIDLYIEISIINKSVNALFERNDIFSLTYCGKITLGVLIINIATNLIYLFTNKMLSYNRDNSLYYIMSFFLIWLMISSFMPIIEFDNLDEAFSFFSISSVIDRMNKFGINIDLLYVISFWCKLFYFGGILLFIYYIYIINKPNREKTKICKISLYTTLSLSIPILMVLIGKILIYVKLDINLLTLTKIGWITLAIMIINVILSYRSISNYNLNKKSVKNAYKKTCKMCRTRYSESSCPVCGCNLIVK